MLNLAEYRQRPTVDLLHAMQALSQLSYSPEFAIRRAIFRSLRQPSGHRHAHPLLGRMNMKWRPLGDSNPCYRRERAVSYDQLVKSQLLYRLS